MIEFKKLAIAGAVSALVLGATTAQAHVTYNFATTATGTLNTANGNATNGAGVWTDGAVAGYVGKLPVTWAAYVHNDSNPNASYTVSTANALADASAANITAPAGFAIETLNNKWNPLTSWGNALDFGLLDLHAAGNLTIKVAADAGSTFTPGFTLFSGWDTAANSSKHGAWNVALPAVPVNPRNSAGLTYVGQASTTVAGGVASYQFTNLSAGQYSLWIGGNAPAILNANGSYSSVSTAAGTQKYIATITASPVPVPGAVWLFGSAAAGFMGLRKRKQAA